MNSTKKSKQSPVDVKAPLPTYTTQQILDLEHEWRLKLKASGFQDVEMWSNKPESKVKKLKFIKGQVRMYWYKTRENFWRDMKDKHNYYRVIGLYAHHAPVTTVDAKYREILKELAVCGNRQHAIDRAAPHIKRSSFIMYLKRNLPKMLAFVNKLDDTIEQEERVYNEQLI